MKQDINDVLQVEGEEGVRARLADAKPYNGKATPASIRAAIKGGAAADDADTGAAGGGHKLIVRRTSVIKPEPISWIWQDRFARGKQTAVAGEPGLGKSQFGVFMVATITVGGSWPHGAGEAPKGRVIILSAEDDAADTIVPRLMAAGADLDLVEILHAVDRQDGKARSCFNLQTDLGMLEERIKHWGSITADEAVAASSRAEKAPALAEAKQFLTEIIKRGGTKLEVIERDAKAARLSWSTVRRAKDELGIKSVRAGFSPEDGWLWKF